MERSEKVDRRDVLVARTARNCSQNSNQHCLLSYCTNKQAKPNITPNRQKKAKTGRKKRQGGGASGLCHAVPSASTQLAFLLLNQTAWLVVVLWVLTPPPLAPEPSCSASFLFVWLKTWPFFTPRQDTGSNVRGGGGGGEEEKHKGEGQRGGWRGEGKGRDTEHSRVGIDLLH